MIIHENKSTFAVATGIEIPSANIKTGPQIQIWILAQDVNPVESVKTGHDAKTVCKGCIYSHGKGCYVRVEQAPLAVWKKYMAGGYDKLYPRDYRETFYNRSVRFGAYGNPSLIPLSIVKAIASSAKSHTGYFHDWKEMPAAKARAYAHFFMASTETEESKCLADIKGLRYFDASPTKPDGAIECLNTSHGITCEKCGLCSGNTKSRLPSIWVQLHGKGKGIAAKAINDQLTRSESHHTTNNN